MVKARRLRRYVLSYAIASSSSSNAMLTMQRPGPKSSKSDSVVLKLTRSTSRSSNTSSQHGHDNKGNGGRPRFKEKDSEGSVVVVDDSGQEVEIEQGEVEDEEWDDDDTPPKVKQDGEEDEEEEEDSDKDPMSQAMRRTMSASVATLKTQSPEEMSVKPASITSPISTTSRPEAPVLTTRKTTGFGGKHPEPSPEPEVYEPLRRTQSVKELAAEAIGSERKATAQKLAMTDQSQGQKSHTRQGSSGAGGPSRTRSTDGSGIPNDKAAQIETSPSYPFPRVLDAGLERTTSNGLRQSSGHSTPAERKSSNGLRHIPSNTSIRSTVSYRAPPHPLNSSLGHARTASTALSTDMDMRRSMHQPPLAPPVIYRVQAEGHTWDLLESPEAEPPAPPQMSRRESTSSQRSLRAIFQPTSSRMQQRSASGPSPGHAQSGASSQNGPIPNRRPTAMEAASAASKMHTTTNAALYHQSLGYSTSQAETAHLISRFLPAKPAHKAPWILTSDSEPGAKGITESEYKPSHDSLCRMMKNLGVPPKTSRNRNQTGSGFRKASRFTSNLLTVPVVGIIKSKNGPLRIERGGWGGKTPIELSIARCQAQRPKGPGR